MALLFLRPSTLLILPLQPPEAHCPAPALGKQNPMTCPKVLCSLRLVRALVCLPGRAGRGEPLAPLPWGLECSPAPAQLPEGSGRSLAASPEAEQCPMTRRAAVVLNKSWSSEKPYCVHRANGACAASLMSNKHCASFGAIHLARTTECPHSDLWDAWMLIPNKFS